MPTITPTTEQIVQLFVRGMSFAEIAQECHIDESVVEHALRRWLYVRGMK